MSETNNTSIETEEENMQIRSLNELFLMKENDPEYQFCEIFQDEIIQYFNYTTGLVNVNLIKCHVCRHLICFHTIRPDGSILIDAAPVDSYDDVIENRRQLVLPLYDPRLVTDEEMVELAENKTQLLIISTGTVNTPYSVGIHKRDNVDNILNSLRDHEHANRDLYHRIESLRFEHGKEINQLKSQNGLFATEIARITAANAEITAENTRINYEIAHLVAAVNSLQIQLTNKYSAI